MCIRDRSLWERLSGLHHGEIQRGVLHLPADRRGVHGLWGHRVRAVAAGDGVLAGLSVSYTHLLADAESAILKSLLCACGALSFDENTLALGVYSKSSAFSNTPQGNQSSI